MGRNKLIRMTSVHADPVCCGCAACLNICPKQCIKMVPDDEGFSHPIVDITTCVDCGLCEKVCPMLHPFSEEEPISTIVATNKDDEVRKRSSSGGFFYALAEMVISRNGIVFGASFDEHWNVSIRHTDNIEGVKKFQGAKYVQAEIGKSYLLVRTYLQEGRWVLFTGLPCQISGLKHFLDKDYKKLITAECVCHSVPSPKVWRSYLNSVSEERTIKDINFRNKDEGWSHYGYQLVINFNNGESFKAPSSNVYMQGLVQNLTVRPSCAKCTAKNGRSHADFSMGDYWGVWDLQPELDDNKGTSIVVIHTKKAVDLLPLLNIKVKKANLEEARKYNLGLDKPTPLHYRHETFFRNVGKSPTEKLLSKYLNDTKLPKLIIHKIWKCWRKLCKFYLTANSSSK